jgi:hypothetical protein
MPSTARLPSRLLLAGAVLAVAIAALYLIFVRSEGAWWARRGDVFVLASARRVSTLLEERRRTTGRYPRRVDEAPGLAEAVEELERACEARGRRVTRVELGAETMARATTSDTVVLVVSGAGDVKLVVFGGDGRVALSRDLLTRPARDLPQWASELPSAPVPTR